MMAVNAAFIGNNPKLGRLHQLLRQLTTKTGSWLKYSKKPIYAARASKLVFFEELLIAMHRGD